MLFSCHFESCIEEIFALDWCRVKQQFARLLEVYGQDTFETIYTAFSKQNNNIFQEFIYSKCKSPESLERKMCGLKKKDKAKKPKMTKNSHWYWGYSKGKNPATQKATKLNIGQYIFAVKFFILKLSYMSFSNHLHIIFIYVQINDVCDS